LALKVFFQNLSVEKIFLRKNLKTVDECIYDRLQKILKLHQARENREKLLQKLEVFFIQTTL
jgi:hypothetical protein